MARELKPQVVETFRHNSMDVKVLLDRNRLEFYAQVGDVKTVHVSTAHEAKDNGRALANTALPFKWERVIQASVELDRDESNNYWDQKSPSRKRFRLAGEFERFERSRTADDSGWLKRPFLEDLTDHQRDQARGEELKFSEHWNDPAEMTRRYEPDKQPDLVAPFTQELWDALLALKVATEEARAKVERLLDPKAGGVPLLQLGNRPLLGTGSVPAPSKKGARRG